ICCAFGSQSSTNWHRLAHRPSPWSARSSRKSDIANLQDRAAARRRARVRDGNRRKISADIRPHKGAHQVMKAFLMYSDRDFDPQRILAHRAKEIRREQGPNLERLLPWNEQALRQDLGLDILFNAMAAGDDFLFEVAKVAVLSSVTDVDTIRY